jgi:hypothetical protein
MFEFFMGRRSHETDARPNIEMLKGFVVAIIAPSRAPTRHQLISQEPP